MIEEMAAALAAHIAGAINDGAFDAVEEALFELGARDGLEVELPGVLSDPDRGSKWVAEELVLRPEIHQALAGVATTLLYKLKNGA